MTPEQARKLRALGQLLDAAGDVVADLVDSLEDEEPRGPGRPRVEPTAEQVRELLRLVHANGRLSERELARRVGLHRRVVRRTLEEHAVVQNAALVAQKPSASRPPAAGSLKATGPARIFEKRLGRPEEGA
jgi:hypothetical protein